MKYTYTVRMEEGNEPGEVYAYYLRDGEKIAIAGIHDSLVSEITSWILKGEMPANGTFYRF